jgi:hypothetical protein
LNAAGRVLGYLSAANGVLLPEGATAESVASILLNPLAALAMIETVILRSRLSNYDFLPEKSCPFQNAIKRTPKWDYGD